MCPPQGLGLCIGDKWATWQLLEGWDHAGRDIGWAEMVAIELVVLWLTQSSGHDHCLKVHGNNTSVIASFWKGQSRNAPLNHSLCRSSASLAASNLSIAPTYIPSALNKADPLSRGLAGTDDCHVLPKIVLPNELCPSLDPI